MNSAKGRIAQGQRIGHTPRGPRGFALVMVLVLLVAATLLAVTVIHQSAGQERLAANERGWSMAFAGAEFAVRSAERWLYGYAATAGGAALVSTAALGGHVYGRAGGVTHPSLATFLAPREWSTTGAKAVTEADFTAGEATARLAAQPHYVVIDLGKFRPAGAGTVGEGGATGNSGYEGSGGMSPAGNADLRVFRIIGKSTGPGMDPATAPVVTLESTFAGRPQG